MLVIAAIFLLAALLLLVVCFWSELAPCLAWGALHHHASPELLACLRGDPAEPQQIAGSGVGLAPAEAVAVAGAAAANPATVGTAPDEALRIVQLAYDPMEDIAARPEGATNAGNAHTRRAMHDAV